MEMASVWMRLTLSAATVVQTTQELCVINIDDCLSNPCGGHSQCVDGVNTFDCMIV